MSVERRNGGWVARWKDAAGKSRAKTFDRKRDADDWDTTIKRAKQTGTLAQNEGGGQTLAELGAEHFAAVGSDLAASTRKVYAVLWNRHVMPRIGGVRLRDLSAEVLEDFRAELGKAAVGPQSIRKTMVLVQTVLQRAVERGRLATNPAKLARKPAAAAARRANPIVPAAVEDMRAALGLRDATLVSVLAYSGLRPGEALALTWGHVRRQTLHVERAVAGGRIGPTKTGATRSVRLLAPLAADLSAWRAAAGDPPDDALIFPAADGAPWSEAARKNWRRRQFAPAAAAAGLPPIRPYDLRHSFVSLRIYEGGVGG